MTEIQLATTMIIYSLSSLFYTTKVTGYEQLKWWERWIVHAVDFGLSLLSVWLVWKCFLQEN